MTRVKICGVSAPAHALAAAEAGADFIGMIFAPSPRQVTTTQARSIVEAVRREAKAPRPKLVGVFVNAEAKAVNAAAAEAGLDLVQLSGDEDLDYLDGIEPPVIKAVHVSGREPGKVAALGLRRTLAHLRGANAIPLLDTKVQGMYGGTGRAFDWEVAQDLAQDFQFLIAGGLTPDNVGQALRRVHPWGVDVSSGVETGGVKDLAKIRAFIQAARAS